jgi:hypothetical protein
MPRVRGQGSEADQSPPSSAKVKNTLYFYKFIFTVHEPTAPVC